MSSLVRSALKRVIDGVPPIAVAYRTLREHAEVRNAKIGVTPLGFKFSGNSKMVQGTYEPEEVQVFSELLRNIDVVVNVGANIGYYCCIALQQGKRAIAFEPMAANLQLLYRNFALNDWTDRVEVFPMALSDRQGLIEMYGSGTGASVIPGWAGAPEHFRRWVPCSTLDTVLQSRLNGSRVLFLVDVEGAELPMLRGAVAQFKLEPRPTWLMEITSTQHQPGQRMNPDFLAAFELFWAQGYEVWTAHPQSIRLSREDILAVVNDPSRRLPTHNFIFVPGK